MAGTSDSGTYRKRLPVSAMYKKREKNNMETEDLVVIIFQYDSTNENAAQMRTSKILKPCIVSTQNLVFGRTLFNQNQLIPPASARK